MTGRDRSAVEVSTAPVRVLVTGGSGLLGTALRKLDPTLICPPRAELDVVDPISIANALDEHRPEVVLHAAAFTRNVAIRHDPARAVRVNVAGTANIAAACIDRGLRLVYVSSDYVYADTPGPHREDEALYPLSAYAWTKLGGECAVRLVPRHLIIRTTFGPVPYEYAAAAADKRTSRMYVTEAAPRILELARSALEGVVNVGDEPRSMLEYARRTRPDVGETTIAALGEPIPVDTSLDLTRWRRWLANRSSGSDKP